MKMPDHIDKNDFLHGIQAQFQRDMLIKHGEMCICMDSTHRTNEDLKTRVVYSTHRPIRSP